MLKGPSRLYLILFFLSEALMVAVSVFLIHRYDHVQPLVLGLFLICILLGLLLMRSLTAMIRQDARLQALEKLKDMEIEQLAALVQTGQDMDVIRARLKDAPQPAADLEHEEPALYISRCDNPVVDAVLFRESKQMKEQNIRCHLHAALPEGLNLDPAVLLSLFTNLLDNAARAAAQCPENHRFVSLDARLQCNCLICVCDNSVAEQASLTPGESTKKAPGHGQGLQILEDLCAQYGGELTGCIDQGRCRFTATLWLEEPA